MIADGERRVSGTGTHLTQVMMAPGVLMEGGGRHPPPTATQSPPSTDNKSGGQHQNGQAAQRRNTITTPIAIMPRGNINWYGERHHPENSQALAQLLLEQMSHSDRQKKDSEIHWQ